METNVKEKTWMLFDGKEYRGPFSIEELKDIEAQNRGKSLKVNHQGGEDWIPIEEVVVEEFVQVKDQTNQKLKQTQHRVKDKVPTQVTPKRSKWESLVLRKIVLGFLILSGMVGIGWVVMQYGFQVDPPKDLAPSELEQLIHPAQNSGGKDWAGLAVGPQSSTRPVFWVSLSPSLRGKPLQLRLHALSESLVGGPIIDIVKEFQTKDRYISVGPLSTSNQENLVRGEYRVSVEGASIQTAGVRYATRKYFLGGSKDEAYLKELKKAQELRKKFRVEWKQDFTQALDWIQSGWDQVMESHSTKKSLPTDWRKGFTPIFATLDQLETDHREKNIMSEAFQSIEWARSALNEIFGMEECLRKFRQNYCVQNSGSSLEFIRSARAQAEKMSLEPKEEP